MPAALIAAAIAISMALHDAEIEHRNEAVLDQLTGMLNRKALESRTVELEVQSRVSRQPVGLIVCDIDRFKAVNDRHGHAAGDAVLRDIAYRIRKELRAYDLAYRLGGEEFVVLLPGAGPELREPVRTGRRGALPGEGRRSQPRHHRGRRSGQSHHLNVSGGAGAHSLGISACLDQAVTYLCLRSCGAPAVVRRATCRQASASRHVRTAAPSCTSSTRFGTDVVCPRR